MAELWGVPEKWARHHMEADLEITRMRAELQTALSERVDAVAQSWHEGFAAASNPPPAPDSLLPGLRHAREVFCGERKWSVGVADWLDAEIASYAATPPAPAPSGVADANWTPDGPQMAPPALLPEDANRWQHLAGALNINEWQRGTIEAGVKFMAEQAAALTASEAECNRLRAEVARLREGSPGLHRAAQRVYDIYARGGTYEDQTDFQQQAHSALGALRMALNAAPPAPAAAREADLLPGLRLAYAKVHCIYESNTPLTDEWTEFTCWLRAEISRRGDNT